jgi:HPP family
LHLKVVPHTFIIQHLVMQNQTLPSLPTSNSTQPGPNLPVSSSTTLSVRSKLPANDASSPPSPQASALDRFREAWKFKEDYRARLPLNISRFLGYRSPSESPPYEPLPIFPFTLLNRISLKHEVWIFAFLGSFVSILLIEAIMSTHTAFQDVYHSPIIVSSFGASAVLVFGVIESPLAQPRNLVLGHFVSSLVSVAMTRLWARNGSYLTRVDNTAFYAPSFINGGLCMSVSLLAQLVLGIAHPPGGATGLAAATEKDIVLLSWHYLPVVLTSAVVMLAWAMVVNNLGRRRYPLYWWSMQTNLVKNAPENLEQQVLEKLEEGALRAAEDGGREPEALFMERLYTESSSAQHPLDRPFSRGSI